MAEITPRINATYLESFQDRVVRIVGKITQLRGSQIMMDSSGPVTLVPQRSSHFAEGHYYEVIGRVKNDLNVTVLSATDFGTDYGKTAGPLPIPPVTDPL